MANSRARGVSPPRGPYGEPRTSTAPVFSTAFDTRYAQQPRNTVTSLTSSRVLAERHVDAQPTSRRNYAASAQSAGQSKIEYVVRPRNDPRGEDEGRTPLRSLELPTTPPRSRPIVDNLPRDQPRSPPTNRYYRDDSSRYILPATSTPRHYRPQEGTIPADSTRLAPVGRERREHSGYLIAGSRGYPTSGALVRYDDEDDYSYTTPLEQFDRDYPPPERRPRRNSYIRQDRPTSTSEFDNLETSQAKREPGPPPVVRQFHKIGEREKHHPINRSEKYSDSEPGDFQPRRRLSLRVPVSLHQNRWERTERHRDERSARGPSRHQPEAYDEEANYYSDRENYRPGSHYGRHHHRPRTRDDSRDRSDKSHGLATAGFGGLAAAGLVSAMVKKPREKDVDSDRDEMRDIKDRHAREGSRKSGDVGRDLERTAEKLRERATETRDEDPRDRRRDKSRKERSDSDSDAPRDRRREKSRKERSDSDSIDDVHTDNQRRRRKHRHHRRDSRPQKLEPTSTLDDRKGGEVPTEVDSDRAERDSAQEDSDFPRRDRRHSRARQPVLPGDEGYAGIPAIGEEEAGQDDRAARLQLVEPSTSDEPEPKPKGILKPARQVPFPEDPNPTREGVAPLKDAGKKGIPPGARWTKINRMLVNPAALEAAHERYEEREEYVIVLRVLSREEIQKYADDTKEIRGKDAQLFLRC